MIDVCINNGSCWNVELIESQYINISTYRPLSRSFYVNLPLGLRSPEKRVINKKKKKEKKKLKNVFYGVMLDTLILRENIRKN